MKKFFKIEIHDYMDMYPDTEVQCMEEALFDEWLKNMKERYNSGTVKLLKVLTQEEARQEVLKLVSREEKHPQPDSKEFIQRAWDLFNQAYC